MGKRGNPHSPLTLVIDSTHALKYNLNNNNNNLNKQPQVTVKISKIYRVTWVEGGGEGAHNSQYQPVSDLADQTRKLAGTDQ